MFVKVSNGKGETIKRSMPPDSSWTNGHCDCEIGINNLAPSHIHGLEQDFSKISTYGHLRGVEYGINYKAINWTEHSSDMYVESNGNEDRCSNVSKFFPFK